MENGLQAIELRDLDAGIQNKSSDLAIEGEFQRFPLNGASKNWSFGKRKGLTTRYGIMPFPGHNSSDNLGETQIAIGSLRDYYPRNLVNCEATLAPPHIKKYDSLRNTYDVYENRNSVLGAAIFSQPVQPRINQKDYPVLYWLTIRTRSTTASVTTYQLDAAPSTSWLNSTVTDGQEMVSQYEGAVGGGSAIIPCKSSDYGVKETDTISFQLGNARLLTVDPVRVRRSSEIKWFMNFTEHKYNAGIYANDFVIKTVTSAESNVRPNDGTFSSLGIAYIAKRTSTATNPITLTVSARLASGTLKIWSCTANITSKTEKKNDLVFTGGNIRFVFNLFSPSINVASGLLSFDTANIEWTVTKPVGVEKSYDYEYVKHDEYSASIGVQMIAMVKDGDPIVAIKNNFISDKTEALLSSDFTTSPNGPSSYTNDYLMWANVTENIYAPLQFITQEASVAPGTNYTEKFGATAIPVNTCWERAFAFDATVATTGVVTNKGVLEANKIYEYAYSIVNKITGAESNVGVPAKVFTGAVTNGGIYVFKSDISPTIDNVFPNQTTAFPSLGSVLKLITKDSAADYATNGNVPVNFFSYRLYYREVGSFEWLFSGEVSFAQVYFESYGKDIYIGASDAVGLPGGQPGAYVDNSPLTSDKYLDVCSFAGKLWWLSKDAVRFSSQNAFIYPIRNFISASSGEFRGAKVHYFPGQAEARGRLVVFGTKSTYDIRQTNEFLTTQVQVSATAQPQVVPIPDSNLSISERSTHTAFSGRSAVVAEGVLYYWGPTGVFRDDGVNFPMRISDALEPDLFSSYDETKTEETFAYYNKKSQEILFFYRPKSTADGSLTKAFVYSLRVENWSQGIIGAWLEYTYKSVIDWAQEIDLSRFIGGRVGDTPETPRGSGVRTLIGARAASNSTVSRPYFHDDLCDCGDMTPGTEMMVKTITWIDSTTTRLTFASDYNATILGNAAVNGTVYIFGSKEYGQIATSIDGLRKIKAKGAGTIDILTVATANFATINLGIRSFFPVYFQDHAVSCFIDTNFFAPYGTSKWCRFRYSHLLIQPTSLYAGTVNPSAVISWNCNHTIADVVSKTIAPIALNSREKTTQVIFDMASPGMQAEGQGVELQVSYSQIGPRWTLFAWTLWTEPYEGLRNILTYQQ